MAGLGSQHTDSGRVTLFDRFSQRATKAVTTPWFFAVTVLALLLWVPTLIGADPNISDLVIDAITNPVSLLLLVLLQNSQSRSDDAADKRLDQLSRGLALLLEDAAAHDRDESHQRALRAQAEELWRAAEKEERVATAGQG